MNDSEHLKKYLQHLLVPKGLIFQSDFRMYLVCAIHNKVIAPKKENKSKPMIIPEIDI